MVLQVVFKEVVKDMIFDGWLQQFTNNKGQSYGTVVINSPFYEQVSRDLFSKHQVV